MKQTALMAGAYLHHLCFESPNPERLSIFYGEILEMKPKPLGKDTWLCSGKKRQIFLDVLIHEFSFDSETFLFADLALKKEFKGRKQQRSFIACILVVVNGFKQKLQERFIIKK